MGVGVDGDDDGVVWGRGFEGGELGGEEVRGHEVAGACGEPGGDEIAGAVEEDDADVRAGACGEEVAVGGFEGGAGEDGGAALGGGVDDVGAEVLEPREAVGVGERDFCGHFGFVFRGVEVVGVDEGGVEEIGEEEADGGFAGAGDAHDDDDAGGGGLHNSISDCVWFLAEGR